MKMHAMNMTRVNMGGMNGMGGMHGMNGMGGMDGMMMMYFHTGIHAHILFKELHTTTLGELLAACLAVCLLAVAYEFLKVGREQLHRRHVIRGTVSRTLRHGNQQEKTLLLAKRAERGRLCSGLHCLQTVLHGVQIFLSYCLMLVFMTYNVYLCLSVIVGACLGYFFTGWRRSVTDQYEHCH